MAANMLAALFKDPDSSQHQEEWKKSRELFTKQLSTDAKEVTGKMLTTLGADLKQVVDEIVSQTTEFWTAQIHMLEEAHKDQVKQLQQDLADTNKQLDDTVTMYNQVVQSLNSQLAEAHEVADAAKRVAESKAAVAHQQSAGSTDTAELARQLAASQAMAQEADQKAQQRRLILVQAQNDMYAELGVPGVQTVEQQHREIEDLQKQLLKANARDQQLTKVSEHLLAKQAALAAEVKSLKAQLAEARGEPRASASSSSGGGGVDRHVVEALQPDYKPSSSSKSRGMQGSVVVVDDIDRLPPARARSSSGNGASTAPGGGASSRLPTSPLPSPGSGTTRVGIGSRRTSQTSASPRTSQGGGSKPV